MFQLSLMDMIVEFVCLYARCLAQRSAFSFNQQDILAFRKQMVAEILSKKLF